MFIRKIQATDNEAIADLIRKVISEFDVDPSQTIAGDPALDHMYENYQDPRAVYYIVEKRGRILGGAGINRLPGADEDTCELQRMFLAPEARGHGMGRQLMMLCQSKAKEFHYRKIYLETLSQMDLARNLYERSGFKVIDGPLGRTGHGGCNVFMLLELKD